MLVKKIYNNLWMLLKEINQSLFKEANLRIEVAYAPCATSKSLALIYSNYCWITRVTCIIFNIDNVSFIIRILKIEF